MRYGDAFCRWSIPRWPLRARAARAQGFAGRLIIIGDEPHRPYDRPPLSKDFFLGAITTEDLFLETDDDGLQAEWILGVGAVGLDAETGPSIWQMDNQSRLTGESLLRAPVAGRSPP